MNILVQNPFMQAGGAENRIRTLLQALIRRDDIDQVHFMFVGPESHHQEEADGKFHYWQIRKNHEKAVTKTIIEEYGIDIVQFHNSLSMGVRGLEYAQEQGIPTVWVMHDFWTMCPNLFFTKVWEAHRHELCYEVDAEKCIECAGYYNYMATKEEGKLLKNVMWALFHQSVLEISFIMLDL